MILVKLEVPLEIPHQLDSQVGLRAESKRPSSLRLENKKAPELKLRVLKRKVLNVSPRRASVLLRMGCVPGLREISFVAVGSPGDGQQRSPVCLNEPPSNSPTIGGPQLKVLLIASQQRRAAATHFRRKCSGVFGIKPHAVCAVGVILKIELRAGSQSRCVLFGVEPHVR